MTPAPPLAVQVLTKASLTMLAQVLSDDPQAQVTDLAAAPLPSPRPQERQERLRLAWQGPRGSGERALLLTALPALTWSEAIAPALPAPAEVLMVETEGLRRFSAAIDDHAIAAGRRHERRPAWILYEDATDLPTVAQAALPDSRSRLLAALAAFHAPYWGTRAALDEVGLPHFSTWVTEQCYFLAGLLGREAEEASPYAHWAAAEWPTLAQSLPTAWDTLPAHERAPLEALLRDPDALVAQVAASPHAVLHGNWRAEALRWRGERLVVDEWAFLQVGPVAWDMYSLLQAPALDALAEYLRHLDPQRPATEAERQALEQAYARCPLLDTLLHPQETAPREWLMRLAAQAATLT